MLGGAAVIQIASSSVDPSSFASTSASSGSSDFNILAGSLAFVSDGTNKTQAEAALRSQLASRLDIPSNSLVVNASKDFWTRKMLFSDKTISVWRVNFVAPLPSARVESVREQMMVLSKSIAEDDADSFSSGFRSSLTEVGAQPPAGLLVVDLQIQDPEVSTTTTSGAEAVNGPGSKDSDSPVLVILLVVVGVMLLACLSYWACSGKSGATQEPSVKIETGAFSEIQQLESRRWALGESVLDQGSQALDMHMPSQWSGTWTWVAQTQLQGAASAPRQKRYNLSFDGGTVEGRTDDYQVTQRVIGGAYDPANEGRIMWREVTANSGNSGGLITECEGQLQVREPQPGSSSRMCVIQGTFAAYDTSTAPPQRRGRGHFVIQAEAQEPVLDQAPAKNLHQPAVRCAADEHHRAASSQRFTDVLQEPSHGAQSRLHISEGQHAQPMNSTLRHHDSPPGPMYSVGHYGRDQRDLPPSGQDVEPMTVSDRV